MLGNGCHFLATSCWLGVKKEKGDINPMGLKVGLVGEEVGRVRGLEGKSNIQ